METYMNTNEYTIEKKIYIPCEKTQGGIAVIKFIHIIATNQTYVGIGEDEWVIKNGLNANQLTITTGDNL